MAKTTTYAIIAIVVIIIIVGVVAFMFYKPGGGNPGGPLSGSNIDIYAVDYKFGSSSTALGSPGPEIDLTAGQTVTITLHNVGQTAHDFAIVTARTDGNTNLAFTGAQVASVASPVQPGQSMSATFTVGSAGSYYYICQISNHASLGMYGTVKVS